MPLTKDHGAPAKLRTFQIAQGERPGVETSEGAHAGQAAEAKEHKPGEVPPADLLFANAVFVALLMVALGIAFTRRLHEVPKGFANLGEWLAESLRDFTVGTIGPGGEKHIPLVGTIFLYILMMNLIGLIPGFHSPTSNVTNTLALGLIVFVYVQYWGIRTNGLGGYLRHFMGPSLNKSGVPHLFFLLGPIELISELIKPFTLAIRLFGNIFGEDVILLVLAGLAGSLAGPAVGFTPLHFPILFLALLTALVQALVFAILTCIYLSLVTAHGPGDEHGEHAAEGDHAPAAAH
jgi:F-type H+-transporting ATPase subunit a